MLMIDFLLEYEPYPQSEAFCNPKQIFSDCPVWSCINLPINSTIIIVGTACSLLTTISIQYICCIPYIVWGKFKIYFSKDRWRGWRMSLGVALGVGRCIVRWAEPQVLVQAQVESSHCRFPFALSVGSFAWCPLFLGLPEARLLQWVWVYAVGLDSGTVRPPRCRCRPPMEASLA